MQYKRSRHLNPELLDTLVALHEHGNFKLAADSLNITQSAVSQRLGRLEATLGVPLMCRRKQVALTAAGMLVLKHALVAKEMARSVMRELELQRELPVVGPLGESVNDVEFASGDDRREPAMSTV